MKPSRRFLALLFALILAGCEDARTQYAQSLGTAPPVAPPPQAPRDDWLTFAHDPLRTGLQPQLTGLDATSVARLRLRWVARLGEPIMASPLVTPPRVYVAGRRGTVRALDPRTGRVLWTTHLGGDIEMTPALADGLLFVGMRSRPGVFAALAAATGAVTWRVRFPGPIRSDPVAVRGVVYAGEAGGDVPFCGRGGVRALDERTGRLLWTWFVAPRAHQGGGVWSPLSFDGTHLIFGTGTGCVPNLDAANAVVALDLRGKRVWSHPVASSNSDDDFGGGTLLMHGQAIAVNRNGSLYDLDAATGDLVWTTPLGTAPRSTGIGSPTSDGATILASPPGGGLIAFDTAGRQRWKLPSRTPFSGAAAIEGGLAFAALDDRFVAIDLSSGSVVWSYPAGGSAYASPAVVPSGVYFANDAGEVFAFSRSRSTSRQRH